MAGQVRKAARTKARRLREQFDIPLDEPLPDILALTREDLEIPVVIFEGLDHDLAGAYLRRLGKPLVFLNGDQAVVRMRFTLAHELGHHCFEDDVQPDTHAGLARPGHWIEVRANAFASELLMPQEAVEDWCQGTSCGMEQVVQIAGDFGVSALVATFRLQSAGLLEDPERVVEEVKAGDHLKGFPKPKPLDDTLARATQRLPFISPELHDSVFVRAALGQLSMDEAAKRLGTTREVLESALAPLGLLAPR